MASLPPFSVQEDIPRPSLSAAWDPVEPDHLDLRAWDGFYPEIEGRVETLAQSEIASLAASDGKSSEPDAFYPETMELIESELPPSGAAPKKKKFVCDRCPKDFTREVDLKRHLFKVHEDKDSEPEKGAFACKVADCGKSYLRKGELKIHVLQKHPEALASMPELTNKSTREKKSYQCIYKECPSGFTRQNDVIRHIEKKHRTNKGEFLCPRSSCRFHGSHPEDLIQHAEDESHGRSVDQFNSHRRSQWHL